MRLTAASLLDRCLLTRSPGKTMVIASMGCLLGSYLIILALEIFLDSQDILTEDARDFITLNKKVKGGLLQNLDQLTKPFQLMNWRKSVAFPGLGHRRFFTKSFPVDHKYMASRQDWIGCGCTDGFIFRIHTRPFSRPETR